MSDIRVMLLFVAVHLAGLGVGAWVVLSPETAAWLLAPAIAIAIAAVTSRMDGEP
jgi:hypothetical protein